MALGTITITPDITLQVANATLTYCYLGEPLNVSVFESNVSATEIYADVTLIDIATGAYEAAYVKYVSYDYIQGTSIKVDLMQIARQLHDYDVYKFQSTGEIATGTNGQDSVISKYIYLFEFYSDGNSGKVPVKKLPIIGIRNYDDFIGTVDYQTLLQELSVAQLSDTKLGGYYLPNYTLKQISAVVDSNYTPTSVNTLVTATADNVPCAGVLYWKSKKGSWMAWGMDVYSKTNNHSYSGDIQTGYFEPTSSGGNAAPSIPANYIKASTGYTINLKSYSISPESLIAVSEIAGSPAVYYQRTTTSKMELMKLVSASAPIDTLIGGGDFSVTLKNIVDLTQRAM